MRSQVFATACALVWLASPQGDRSSSPGLALVMVYCVLAGTLAIAVFPAVRLITSPLSPGLSVLWDTAFEAILTMTREVEQRHDRENQGEENVADEQGRSTNST